eukprot:m.255562 g.255562  ORF g.255562 m.255562 type:complete len:66 (-) comp11011_c0_seq38:1390-1587(-)
MLTSPLQVRAMWQQVFQPRKNGSSWDRVDVVAVRVRQSAQAPASTPSVSPDDPAELSTIITASRR